MSFPIGPVDSTTARLPTPDIGAGRGVHSVAGQQGDLQKLSAGFATLHDIDPARADATRERLAAKLDPVNAGRFMAGIFDDLGDFIKDLLKDIEKAIAKAQAESQKGVDGNPPTTSTQIGAPKTPADAPKSIVFSNGNQAVFEKQWGDSLPGGKSKEQGGTLVFDKKTDRSASRISAETAAHRARSRPIWS